MIVQSTENMKMKKVRAFRRKLYCAAKWNIMKRMLHKESQGESRVRENRTHGLVGGVSVSLNRAAFTLIELLVVIAIITLLVSILLPSLTKAKDLARNAICMSTLRCLGMGIQFYATENQAFFPPYKIGSATGSNSYYMQFYLEDLGYFEKGTDWLCPSDEKPGQYSCGKVSYGYNYLLGAAGLSWANMSALKYPHEMIVMCEASSGGVNGLSSSYLEMYLEYRHRDGYCMNLLKGDFSVCNGETPLSVGGIAWRPVE